VLIVVGVAIIAAFALATYAVLEGAEERATIRSSLRNLEGYEVENLRDRELLAPVQQRAVAPIFRAIVAMGKRYIPSGQAENARRKLTLSGNPSTDAADRFIALRVVLFALIPVWFILAFYVLPVTGNVPLAVFVLLTLASVLGPDSILNRKVAERQHAIQVKLPDILDLLVISVEAGLGFEQALDRTINSVPGPLSDEFVRMLNEVRAGSSRADALRALDTRTDTPEVRSFVLAILQADTFGVSIGRVLRAQADEMRVRRRQLAQEKAQKAPVKMLIPMVFCIFPALFVVVIGPAIINISHNFKS
jgi:tight adherence protein C